MGNPSSLCEVRRVYDNPMAFGAPSGLAFARKESKSA
jgi:hypothetical protein